MTEGELYKKIKEISYKIGDRHKQLWETYGSGTFSEEETEKFTRDVLDEAKKEFPKIEAGSFHKNDDGSIEDYWAKEVINWKKKWFGE